MTTETTRPKSRSPRTGSYVSSKEIARASVDGRQVTFKVANMDPIRGFVVAMDDYHWKIACPVGPIDENPVEAARRDPDEDLFKIVLVHKSAPLVEVDTKPADLQDGTPVMLVLIAMSEKFWQFCNRTYFGRGDTGREATSQESEHQA